MSDPDNQPEGKRGDLPETLMIVLLAVLVLAQAVALGVSVWRLFA